MICLRLMELRQDQKWTRSTLAREMGIDSTILSMLEHLRAPLNYGTAYQIFKNFALNPRWLAEGKGLRHDHVQIPSPKELGVPPTARFSEVYKTRLKDRLEKNARASVKPEEWDFIEKLGGIEWIEMFTRLHSEERFLGKLRDWLVKVPDYRVSDLMIRLEYFGESLVQSYMLDSGPIVEARRVALEKARAAWLKDQKKARAKKKAS
jgi:transcriptional regulator with XRE-family HTH domain